MFNEFKAFIKPYAEKLENILKFGKIIKVNGSNANLQKIQLKTLRNIEDAMKVGQFGFNSKAPSGSRVVLAEISNEKIVIANEHISSIIDVNSGDAIVYNESGTYIKLEGNTITHNATNHIINGDTTINGLLDINGGTVKHNGTDIGDNHFHTQGNDSNGDSEADTSTPTS